MYKGFRILAVAMALTDVHQCNSSIQKVLPLNACYLEHHLCYSSRGEGRMKQL